jgi:hypothetical protein
MMSFVISKGDIAMAEGAEPAEDEVLSSLVTDIMRRQIEVSERRADKRLAELQEANDTLMNQLRLLSADNEVPKPHPQINSAHRLSMTT